MPWPPLVAALAVAAALSVSADTPGMPASTPLRTWTAEQTVAAILPVGGRVYLGGAFGAVGPPAGPLQALRVRDLVHVERVGRIDPHWCPRPNGAVRLLARAGGRLYVAGAFTRIGGTARGALAAVRTTTGRPTAWHPVAPDPDAIVALAAGA